MKPVTGFPDRYAGELRRRRYVAITFGRVAESFGFEPLEVPVVENAAAYDESVVGLSPWPEWNPRGVFEVALPRYEESYDEASGVDRAVLIPEGTLSVTRWLATELGGSTDPASSDVLPRKVYYDVACYRNELLSTLNAAKTRQFTQFGIEILGSGDVLSEIETMCVAAEGLHALGVDDASIAFRISSNGLFSRLAEDSGLEPRTRIALKEALDTLAECKAGKRPERLAGAVTHIEGLLEASAVPEIERKRWRYIIERSFQPVSGADRKALADYAEHLDRIETIAEAVVQLGVRVDVDYCVVRSHEYYTGVTFEIDFVSAGGERAVEVGGGGRYDRLMGNFLAAAPGAIVPCAGYAFGLERLANALEATGHLSEADGFDLSDEDAPTKSLADPSPAGYVSQVAALRERRSRERVSIAVPR